MNKPKGLNGEPVFAAEDVPVGYVLGEPYGYKRRLLVTVSVRMERLTRRDSYETIDHDKVTRPLDFAITLSVWMPSRNDIVVSGRDVGMLSDLVTYSRGFNGGSVKQLAELIPYHLNATRGACAHQIPDQGFDNPNCPATGYRYGSAWLVEPLPKGFLAHVKSLFANSDRAKIWEEGR
jgi:hypothetical protein